MDLADKLIQINNQEVIEEEQGGKEFIDDLGIPTIVADPSDPVELKNNVDYYVARMIKCNEDKVTEGKQGRLHRRGKTIYIGSDVVLKSDNNLMRLCKPQWNIPAFVKPQIWDRLLELLPELSCDKIVITPHMAFNKKTGGLEWSGKPYTDTGTGGFNG